MNETDYYNNTLWFCKVYNNLIEKALLRGLDKSKLDYYTERHHIYPKCMGGEDIENNYVLLTAKEHILAHMLLYRINPQVDGLLRAIALMLSLPRYDIMKVSLKLASYYREEAGKLQKDKVISEDQKIKISKAKKGKKLGKPSEEHRLKISKSKKGKGLGNEVRGPNNDIYSTVTECALAYDTTIGMIHYWIRNRPDKGFSYTGNNTDIPSSRRKKVQGPDGTVYNSMKECYEKTGHDRHTVLEWIRNHPEKEYKFI